MINPSCHHNISTPKILIYSMFYSKVPILIGTRIKADFNSKQRIILALSWKFHIQCMMKKAMAVPRTISQPPMQVTMVPSNCRFSKIS